MCNAVNVVFPVIAAWHTLCWGGVAFEEVQQQQAEQDAFNQEQLNGVVDQFADTQRKLGINPKYFKLDDPEFDIIKYAKRLEAHNKIVAGKKGSKLSKTDVVINTNTTWSVSPVYPEVACPAQINGSLTVSNNVTLTIKGCTDVRVTGNVYVSGTLAMQRLGNYSPILKVAGGLGILVADSSIDTSPAVLRLFSSQIWLDGVIWIDDKASLDISATTPPFSFPPNQLKNLSRNVRWAGINCTNNFKKLNGGRYLSDIDLKDTIILNADYGLNSSWDLGGGSWMQIYNRRIDIDNVEFQNVQYGVTTNNNNGFQPTTPTLNVSNSLFKNVKNYSASPSVDAYLVHTNLSEQVTTIENNEDQQTTSGAFTHGYGFWFEEPYASVTVHANELANIRRNHVLIEYPNAAAFDINDNAFYGMFDGYNWQSIKVLFDADLTFTSSTTSYIRNNELGLGVGQYLGERHGISLYKDGNFTQQDNTVLKVEGNNVRYNLNNVTTTDVAYQIGKYNSSQNSDKYFMKAYFRNNTVSNVGQDYLFMGIFLNKVSMGQVGSEMRFTDNSIIGPMQEGLHINDGEGIINNTQIMSDNATLESINLSYTHMDSASEVLWKLNSNCFYIENASSCHIAAGGYSPPSGNWYADEGYVGSNYFEDYNGDPNLVSCGNINVILTEALTCSLD